MSHNFPYTSYVTHFDHTFFMQRALPQTLNDLFLGISHLVHGAARDLPEQGANLEVCSTARDAAWVACSGEVVEA